MTFSPALRRKLRDSHTSQWVLLSVLAAISR